MIVSARKHICLVHNMSVTWVHQLKTAKLGLCNFHRTAAPHPLAFAGSFHPEILTGFY